MPAQEIAPATACAGVATMLASDGVGARQELRERQRARGAACINAGRRVCAPVLFVVWLECKTNGA